MDNNENIKQAEQRKAEYEYQRSMIISGDPRVLDYIYPFVIDPDYDPTFSSDEIGESSLPAETTWLGLRVRFIVEWRFCPIFQAVKEYYLLSVRDLDNFHLSFNQVFILSVHNLDQRALETLYQKDTGIYGISLKSRSIPAYDCSLLLLPSIWKGIGLRNGFPVRISGFYRGVLFATGSEFSPNRKSLSFLMSFFQTNEIFSKKTFIADRDGLISHI